MTQMLEERLYTNKGIRVSVNSEETTKITASFSTDKTLAPNFNEAI